VDRGEARFGIVIAKSKDVTYYSMSTPGRSLDTVAVRKPDPISTTDNAEKESWKMEKIQMLYLSQNDLEMKTFWYKDPPKPAEGPINSAASLGA
jgi:hypothetical protein